MPLHGTPTSPTVGRGLAAFPFLAVEELSLTSGGQLFPRSGDRRPRQPGRGQLCQESGEDGSSGGRRAEGRGSAGAGRATDVLLRASHPPAAAQALGNLPAMQSPGPTLSAGSESALEQIPWVIFMQIKEALIYNTDSPP